MKKFGWIVLLGTILTSCGNSMPKEIIPPQKMENVLYDYHLTLGISNQLATSEEHKKQAYKNYLFQKHRITEAQFDSSMVWYTRNSYELAAIYKNLEKRLNKEQTKLNNWLKERNISIVTQAGDTVNIWNQYPVYWLSEAPLNNKILFEIKADTNFWANDAFLWNADFNFLSAGKAIIDLNIHLKNDSVIGKTTEVNQSGTNSIYVQADTINEIKTIHGFIHLYKDSIHQSPKAIVSNLSLIKFHTKKENPVQVTDEKEKKPKNDKMKFQEERNTPKKAERISTSRSKKIIPSQE